MSPPLEVADIFQNHGAAYLTHYGKRVPMSHRRAMRAIQICRTAELGGHLDRCEQCGVQRISYNSCRNRHCPKCQFLKAERWVEARKECLLPISYSHVVFTIPQELRAIVLGNQRLLYDVLFEAASATLRQLSRDPKHLGAEIGFTMVLHTWSQTLAYHPHVHCIVTGGGLTTDGRWKATRDNFFLPVKVMSRLFRGKFLDKLRHLLRSRKLAFDTRLLDDLYRKEWIVYCKPPFHNAEHVVAYLGRYTHRIAISNHRLIAHDDTHVRFRYRASRHNNHSATMSLDVLEFMRRFLLHVLPDGFVKIRHYGILSNRSGKKLRQCRALLLTIWTASTPETETSWQDLLLRVAGVDVRVCGNCGGPMMLIEGPPPQRPPPEVPRTAAAA